MQKKHLDKPYPFTYKIMPIKQMTIIIFEKKATLTDA